MTNNIIGGIVAGVIVWWLCDRNKPQPPKAKSRHVHSGRPAAFRDVVRSPCGC